MRRGHAHGIAVALATGALLAASCSDGLQAERPASLDEPVEPGDEDLEGAAITVGSKDFDEQLVLGHLSRLLLEDAGAQITDEINLGGTDAARAALESGEVDHYWEYTGTAWMSFHGQQEPIDDRRGQYEAVRRRDAEQHGLYWLEPSAFNNTYGIAYQADAAPELGRPRTISDLFELADEDPELATLCVESEFEARDDGLPGLQEHYGGEIPGDQVTVLDTGQVYRAIADRDPCTFGEVFTTDGRIAAFDLVVLEDDRSFFPPYHAAPVFTEEVYGRFGQALTELYRPVTAALDADTMASLNARVSADGEDPADVARDLLEEIGAL